MQDAYGNRSNQNNKISRFGGSSSSMQEGKLRRGKKGSRQAVTSVPAPDSPQDSL